MNAKIKLLYLDLQKAVKNLKAAVHEASDDLDVDGTIKRFELCFELSWKLMKDFLADRGVHCFSPRDCFKAAKQAELIHDELIWLNMIDDRNYLVHTYSFDRSREIFSSIQKKYLAAFSFLLKQMKSKF